MLRKALSRASSCTDPIHACNNDHAFFCPRELCELFFTTWLLYGTPDCKLAVMEKKDPSQWFFSDRYTPDTLKVDYMLGAYSIARPDQEPDLRPEDAAGNDGGHPWEGGPTCAESYSDSWMSQSGNKALCLATKAMWQARRAAAKEAAKKAGKWPYYSKSDAMVMMPAHT